MSHLTQKKLQDKADKSTKALAASEIAMDKAQAKVDESPRATKAQMATLDKAIKAHDKAHITADKDQANLVPKKPVVDAEGAVVKSRGGYHFTKVTTKGITQIKVGPGVLRHVIYNAPVVVNPDIVLIDGTSANDGVLNVDADLVIVPGKAQPHEVNNYVIEYHTPFHRGLLIDNKSAFNLTIVWE